jgi:hypothetical protein
MKLRKMIAGVALLGSVVSMAGLPTVAQAATTEGTIAYVSGGGGGSFQRFFTSRGYKFDLVSPADAGTYRFGQANLVVVADNAFAGTYWNTDEALAVAGRIKRSHTPVLAMGEGGGLFLGKVGATISWVNSWYTPTDSASFSDAQASLFSGSVAPRVDASGDVAIYERSVETLAVYGPMMSDTASTLAGQVGNDSHHVLTTETKGDHVYLNWGFRSSTGLMTATGKTIFLQAVRSIQK